MERHIRIIPQPDGYLVVKEVSEGKQVTEKISKDEAMKVRDLFSQALKTGETVVRNEEEKNKIIATLDDLAEFKEHEIKDIKNKIELLNKDLKFTKDLATTLGVQKENLSKMIDKGMKESVDSMTGLLQSCEMAKESFMNTIKTEHEYISNMSKEIENKIARGLTEEEDLAEMKADMEKSKAHLELFKKSVGNKAEMLFKEFEEIRKAHYAKQETYEKKVDTIVSDAKKSVQGIEDDLRDVIKEHKEIIERNKKEVERERIILKELKKKQELDSAKILTVRSKLNKVNEEIEKEILKIKIEEETERVKIQEKFQQSIDLIGNKPDLLYAQVAKLNALAETYQSELTKFSAKSGKTKEEMLQEAQENLEKFHFLKKLGNKVRGK